MILKSKDVFQESVLVSIRILFEARTLMERLQVNDAIQQTLVDVLPSTCAFVLHTFRNETGFQFSENDPVFLNMLKMYQHTLTQIDNQLDQIVGLPITLSAGRREMLIVENSRKLSDKLYEMYSVIEKGLPNQEKKVESK